MKKLKLLLTICACIFNLIAFAQNDRIEVQKTEDFTIGKSVTLYSHILNEERILNIYLPEGYEKDSANNYPVIYLLDGSKKEDFIHIVGLVQFCSYPWIRIASKSIVVGIENVDRKRDFTIPSNVASEKENYPTTGGSAPFIEFLKKEVQPYIENNYSNNPEKTIIGQSLGGLLASEILIKETSLFRNYIIISPSLYWDNYSLLDKEIPQLSAHQAVFVGVGKEGKVMKSVKKKIYKKASKSAVNKNQVFFEYFKNQSHADILHLATYQAFIKVL